MKDLKRFKEIYETESGVDGSTILESIDLLIKKISKGVFARFKVSDSAIGAEDVAQEVRIALWPKLAPMRNKAKEEGVSFEQFFKYVTTLIKNEGFRYLMKTKYTNPRLKSKRKFKDHGVQLSRINLEFFNYRAEYPTDFLVGKFIEKCEEIPHASKIFGFLTEPGTFQEYAGLPINKYFCTLKKMKALAKEIAEELPYGN